MWYIQITDDVPLRGSLGFVVPAATNGPVAQLGARFHGMEEVDGSNPSRSTKSPNKTNTYERDSCASTSWERSLESTRSPDAIPGRIIRLLWDWTLIDSPSDSSWAM